MSFRQTDSTNDALSVRKTRPIPVRNVSIARSSPGKMGALSPPREESTDEEHEIHPAMRLTTPLRSSLKSSSSKRFADLPDRRDQTSDKNTSPERNNATTLPPPRSPSRVASGISPIKKHFETLEAQHHDRVPSPTSMSVARQPDHNQPRSRATPTPTGTYRNCHDQLRHSVTPSSNQTSKEAQDRVKQNTMPSSVRTYDSEYDQLRPESSPTWSDTHSTDFDVSHYCETPTRTEAHRSGYDQVPPQSTPVSTGISKIQTEYGTKCAEDQSLRFCTSRSSSTNDPRSIGPRALTQVDGSPERDSQQPSCDLDPIKAYQAGPGIKVFKAPSTMRSQPRMSHVKPEISAAKLRSTVWKTSSRGSADSAFLSENEPVKKSKTAPKTEKAGLDQMDGAVDCVGSVPSSRGPFIDLRGEFERRGIKEYRQSSPLPVTKSRSQPRAVLTKKNGQGTKPPWASPCRPSPKSSCTGEGRTKPGVNKVMGLAAIFDTAAEASPLVPTPGGAIQKKRRETAGVISPYTSNQSPGASVQSVSSVSTPVSLMSPTRLSIHLSNPVESTGKKCMIPCFRNPSETSSAVRTEGHLSPASTLQRDKSQLSVKSNNPSRLSTSSRLPVIKKTTTTESPLLPQFDGLSTNKQSLLKLTAQQEILPVGFHSSPIPQISGGYIEIPRLSKQSASSRYSDEIGFHSGSTLRNLTPSRGRNASSLRDQIRSLRIELSAKNEDCAQLRLDLEESRKVKEVNDILLREDLDRAKADTIKWRRRAERAERKVNKYERLAMQIKDARDRCRQWDDIADEYSFMSGSDHITTSDRAASQPLTTRMNQTIRRTPPVGANGTNSLGAGDGFSECSSSTVVKTIGASTENGPASSSGLWSAVGELVDFASPGLLEESL